VDRVREDLGLFWDWLPAGGLQHNPNAYLESTIGDGSDTVEERLAV